MNDSQFKIPQLWIARMLCHRIRIADGVGIFNYQYYCASFSSLKNTNCKQNGVLQGETLIKGIKNKIIVKLSFQIA